MFVGRFRKILGPLWSGDHNMLVGTFFPKANNVAGGKRLRRPPAASGSGAGEDWLTPCIDRCAVLLRLSRL